MKYSVISLAPDHLAAARQNSQPVTCKFVLITQPDEACFVYGPVSQFAYHAALVDRFCSERGIPALWQQRPDLVVVADASAKVCGGGWLRLDWSARRAEFYGHSKAYGSFDVPLLRQILGNDPTLEGLPAVFTSQLQAL